MDGVGYIERRLGELGRIPGERGRRLEELARLVGERVAAGETARLIFICTHNSRRSQMSQIWAQTAAAWHGLRGVETYSGGTEATAFHPSAVAALNRAGFDVRRAGQGDNPVYEVRCSDEGPVLRAFSKVYDEDPNPREDFLAVMTCSRAEQTCPVVRGARATMAIPYEDPGAFDGTERETAAYDERCDQIAREMLYLFSRVETRSES